MFEGKTIKQVILQIGLILLVVSFILVFIGFYYSRLMAFVMLFFVAIPGFLILIFAFVMLYGLLIDEFITPFDYTYFYCPICQRKLKLKYIPFRTGEFTCHNCGQRLFKSENGITAN